MLKLLSAGVSFSGNFLACRGGLGKRRIFRAVRRYRMANRVPGAVQRCLRCSAEPGPILTRLHGPRISSASRRGVARRAASGARWRHAFTFPRHVLHGFCLIMSLLAKPRAQGMVLTASFVLSPVIGYRMHTSFL